MPWKSQERKAQHVKVWRRRNPEKVKAQKRRYRETQKEQIKAYKHRYNRSPRKRAADAKYRPSTLGEGARGPTTPNRTLSTVMRRPIKRSTGRSGGPPTQNPIGAPTSYPAGFETFGRNVAGGCTGLLSSVSGKALSPTTCLESPTTCQEKRLRSRVSAQE